MALLLAVASALLGAAAGFYFRGAEFRRDQRLKVYGEYIAAFLSVGHEGASGASLYMQYGESLMFGEHVEKMQAAWPRLGAAIEEFERATARLRLVASGDARAAAVKLETFIEENVRQVPPVRPRSQDGIKDWGYAAQIGPAKIDSETVRLAQEFADRVSRDVTPRRDRRMRKR